ncbi:MAG: hypothetical protein IT313_03640 [Anaerolineales bacterium]|nr:hypothetical protein [Anaerolineales bacterium]
MKIAWKKTSISILLFGISGGIFLSALVVPFLSFSNNNLRFYPLMMIMASLLILQHRKTINEIVDEDTLELKEMWYVGFGVILLVFTSFGFLITFSKDWLAVEARYYCVALGLPILVAFIARAIAGANQIEKSGL